MRISRRTVLRGAGVAVALPFLEAMLPRRALAATEPAAKRFLAWYVPNGIHMPAWTPTSTGTLGELPPILSPLVDLREDVLVLSGLDNFAATPQGDGTGDHARGTAAFLTCAHPQKTAGDNIRNGISLDQRIANELRGTTPFASLELGMDGGGTTGDCDSGYACAYLRNIAWSGPQTPVAKEISTRAVFDRLFGLDPNANPEMAAARKRRRGSILDWVNDDATRLQARLGATDRQKLDEYLTGVRDLERRLEIETPACAPPEPPDGNAAFPQRVRDMCDLMVLAFQCDLTRVATFMLGNGTSSRLYDFLGIDRAHHDISHHQGLASNHEMLQAIDTWEVEQFAYLVQRMKEVQDAEGKPLLDSSILFFSSEIADGDRHVHEDLPVLLAGKGGLTPGRHVRYEEGTPIADLYLGILHRMGIEDAAFGDDGTAPLGDL